jgi:hypothetical protein
VKKNHHAPLSEDDLLMNIISFNVGIEIGQISALAVMLFLIAAFRKSHVFKSFSKASNTFLVIAGAYLFLMQMHGYEHTANAEEFTGNAEPQKIEKLEVVEKIDWNDVITITIPARGDKEYKLMFAKGARFEYAWQSDKGELFFDFHGEPKGDTSGYFKSFEKDTNSQSNGSLTTIFEGTHGWYWKNNNAYPVTITLNVNGEYQRMDLKVDAPQIKPVQMPNKTIHDSL